MQPGHVPWHVLVRHVPKHASGYMLEHILSHTPVSHVPGNIFPDIVHYFYKIHAVLIQTTILADTNQHNHRSDQHKVQ